ncbi:MAG: hypothetical protein J6T01_01975 [Kiritimatiellae bacterium]|nr:hypothetical protein [Kiritimatiellia bacterium]
MQMTRRGFLSAGAALAAATSAKGAAAKGGKRFYKGQFHTHTFWSDGGAFPEQAVQFYRETGYNFLGISDHNVYAEGRRIRKVGNGRGQINTSIFDDYRRKFPGSVETETDADGNLGVVLQPYSKMRELFEKPGEFLLLDAVEATTRVFNADGVENQVHMNYLNVPGVPKYVTECGTDSPVDRRIGETRLAVEALAKELGRETMFILNHPIWCWYDVKPEDLVANPEIRFFELCNGGSPFAPGKGLPADGFATDRFWDVVNAFRARRGQPLLYGVGNDDTHAYFGVVGHVPGIHCLPYNAWSLVRAEELTAEALIRAMNAGDFAVCEGVQPDDFAFDAGRGELSVSVAGKKNLCRTIQFIVTKRDFSEKPVETVSIEAPEVPENKRKVYARTINIYDTAKIGCIVKSVSGGIGEAVSASYRLAPDDLYVRARILSPERPAVSAYQHPKIQVAWTQPYLAAASSTARQ